MWLYLDVEEVAGFRRGSREKNQYPTVKELSQWIIHQFECLLETLKGRFQDSCL